jgi:DNA transformation protein
VAVSKDFLLFVTEQLSSLSGVKSRRMFGGIGLYSDELFFALIDDDTLYFKVNDSNRSEYEQRGSKPFCPFPDKAEFSMSYYDVPADLLDDADELGRWARKSVAIALVAANKKKPKATRKSSGTRTANKPSAKKQTPPARTAK